MEGQVEGRVGSPSATVRLDAQRVQAALEAYAVA